MNLLAKGVIVFGLVAIGATSYAQGTREGEKVTIGKLGQAIEAASIRSNMDDKARVLSKAKAYQYLVINKTKYEQWYAVVLVNGKQGYIPAEKVAELPYDVQVPKQGLSSRSAMSASGRAGTRVNDGDIDSMLQNSFKYIGTKYVWGGNDLRGGIDCSGFVKELYKQIDVNLPRTAREQAKVGTPIERLEDLKPGDRLYFWDKKRGYIGHTGLFLGYHPDGGAYFIHSSSNNRGVATDDLRNEHWRNMLVAARRS